MYPGAEVEARCQLPSRGEDDKSFRWSDVGVRWRCQCGSLYQLTQSGPGPMWSQVATNYEGIEHSSGAWSPSQPHLLPHHNFGWTRQRDREREAAQREEAEREREEEGWEEWVYTGGPPKPSKNLLAGAGAFALSMGILLVACLAEAGKMAGIDEKIAAILGTALFSLVGVGFGAMGLITATELIGRYVDELRAWRDHDPTPVRVIHTPPPPVEHPALGELVETLRVYAPGEARERVEGLLKDQEGQGDE